MEKYIVGMGEALWDVLPDGRKIGGAPANFAYHVSQFGLPGCVVSAVGDDELGREIRECFDAVGLNYKVATVPYPTGVVLVSLDERGIPQYEIKQDVAWDNIPFTAELEELARNTRAFCFGSLAQRNTVSRHTIGRFIDLMPHGDGELVVFDINLRQNFYSPELLADSIERCNILKINDEELDILSNMWGLPSSDFESACRELIARFDLKMLILTCGVNGSYIFTPDGVSYQPTPVVEVADTVGAGDSFTGSFIASLLRGRTVAEAHKTAVETSAFVCSRHGAMPPLPSSLTEF